MKYKIDTGKFRIHQKAWWNTPNFIKMLVGGYGCGKTYIGALRLIYMSYLNAGYPVQYISPSYKMAKRTVIPTLKGQLDRADVRYVFNKTDHEFLIPGWDGKIWIGSGDEPDSLKGPNLSAACIDEPFIQSQEVFEQIIARVRVGEHREIGLTGTPEELNWGYEVAMNDESRYDIGVVHGRTRDNYSLDSDYADTMEAAYTPEQVMAYLEGQFVNLKRGRVYQIFDRGRHIFRGELEQYRDAGIEIIAGIDFNVDYMSAEVAYKGPDWIHFFDEIRLSNSNTEELGEVLREKYPGIRVFPDPSGSARRSSASKSDHAILQQLGFRVVSHKANPPIRERVNAVNRLLKLDKMTIEPQTCPHLVADLDRNVWRSGDLDKTDLKMTHAGDAAGYPIEHLFPIRKQYVGNISKW